MKNVMVIWALLSLLVGAAILSMSRSAIHEALAGVAFVNFILGLGFYGVIDAIQKAVKELGEAGKPN